MGLLTSNTHVFNSEAEICDYFLNFQTRANTYIPRYMTYPTVAMPIEFDLLIIVDYFHVYSSYLLVVVVVYNK